jgi:CRISPR-associated protein (TIGR03986 family)
MTMLKTPYNFVPLSPFVLYPEWAPLASHDHPFADGLSGELAISLIARTPLSVGGKQEPASEQRAGKTHFYRTPDGTPAIPGSTVKGMLRNVLSIATFGRMHQIEERKFSIRNMQKGTPYYTKIVNIEARAGWLRFYQGQWQVKACDYTRLHQQDLINAFGLDVSKWKKAATVKARYGLLGGLSEVRFDVETHKNKTEGVATALGSGSVTGTAVVTGQPGQPFDSVPSAKKWEFIFYQGQSCDWQPVPESTLRDFLFVHDASEEWAFFQKGGHGQEAIPVFWRGPQASAMTSMGLAQMYRLAQKNSLHDALRNTSTHHLDDSRADLAELIFGRLRPEEPGAHDWGLRGRVNVGMLAPEDHAVSCSWTKETVLSSPKPSFYPAYLKQDSENSGPALTLDAKFPELRGWKRYPAKPDYVQSPPSDVTNKVKVSLETVGAGTRFAGKIRFHNLRPAELGALLWVLDFGNRDQLCHALGTGKPYGLGQVQIQVHSDKSSVVPNDRKALRDLTTGQILSASRRVFTAYMDSVWVAVCEKGAKGWVLSPQVSHLLAMADPDEGVRCGDRLTYMVGTDPFTDVKKSKSNEVLKLYGDTPEAVDWAVNPKDALSSYDNEMDLGKALADAEEEKCVQEEKLRLEQERAAMKAGDAVLSQITEKIDGDLSGKTLQSDIEKLIRSILDMDTEERPNPEDADPVLSAVEIHNIKKLNKACKKVRNFLSEQD